jgi:hypothetical protein
MFELIFKNLDNEKEVIHEIVVAKLEKTAKQYAKEFCNHHQNYKLLSIKPC